MLHEVLFCRDVVEYPASTCVSARYAVSSRPFARASFRRRLSGVPPSVISTQLSVWHPCLRLTVSFDHDIIDRAPAARFTQQLKDLIESGYDLNDYAEEKELVGAFAPTMKSER
jgi:hypothetical protein